LAPPLLTAILSAYVQDRSPYARVLRRAFLFGTLLPIGLIGLVVAVTFAGTFEHGVHGVWILLLVGAFVASTLWLPVQIFFVLAFLGLLIVPRTTA
jgi:hypothetical protein